MGILPNECIYEILLFFDLKDLQLCMLINNNFSELCKLDSLWKSKLSSKLSVLFKKKNNYENYKLYYQLDILMEKLISKGGMQYVYNSQEYIQHYNPIGKLPKEIGVLINLRKLNFNFNRLIKIPKEIGQLINLQELYLSKNDLTLLPKEIGQLINLHTFHLNDNKLMELPAEIGQLNKLVNLLLQNNQLKELPKEIGQLSQLQTLNLFNNHLMYLPQDLELLENLLFVDLTFNKLNKKYISVKIKVLPGSMY